jgi:lipopolysaccharide export system protein LptA
MNPLKSKISLLLCLLLCSHMAASFAERADREKPIHMEADRVTVDDANQTSTFEGNVKMQQGTLSIEAGKIVAAQDKNGYSQITATGQPAHFRQKRDGVNEYADGFGERIVYDSFAETADFFGQARVKREGDDVRGEHIIYNTKTGVFQVFGATVKSTDAPNQGRVTIVIQPKDQSNATVPNAPAPPVKPSATPNATKP